MSGGNASIDCSQHHIGYLSWSCRSEAVDPVQERPGFAALLERIRGNGVRTIIVETANRFARDLIVQETGHRMLKAQGIEIIARRQPGRLR
jgi:DNA invertase Pin-like site-specific DNA recombinase